jgi:hypothetical protein
MRPLLNGEDVSEADLNASVNIVCLRQGADIQKKPDTNAGLLLFEQLLKSFN